MGNKGERPHRSNPYRQDNIEDNLFIFRNSRLAMNPGLFVVLAAFVAFVDAMPKKRNFRASEAETINERIESAVNETKTVLDEMKTIQAGMKTVQDEILTSVRKLETGSWKLEPESPEESDIKKGVRLVDANGKIGFSGRLEVYRNGEWGTVCDDGLDSEGANLATVVCRMLGRTGGTAQLGGRTHTAGSGTIHLDDVKCDGTESSIFDCTHISGHNCGHSE